MMRLPFAQIDAFASKSFEGNQACVIPLDEWLPDDVLQAIGAENNVAETAFIVPDGDAQWKLRWFTPAVEVPLCGHATLAAAHWLWRHGGFSSDRLTFETVYSGELYVSQCPDGRLEMDFPAPSVFNMEIAEDVVDALGARPVKVIGGPFYAAEFETPDIVKSLNPDFRALKTLGMSGDGWETGNFGCFSEGGDGVDVTSRFFAPGSGIDEDPATGSWHCMVAAIVGPRLGRAANCYQAFDRRGAHIEAELMGQRVKLRGTCVTVIEGEFRL
ncbi:MAG: PhzF family phenazine biosynthesis protein [Pseudomonadota bacterium]